MKLVHRYWQFALVFVVAVSLAAPAGVAAAAGSPEQARSANLQMTLPAVSSQLADALDPGNADSVSWTMATWYQDY